MSKIPQDAILRISDKIDINLVKDGKVTDWTGTNNWKYLSEIVQVDGTDNTLHPSRFCRNKSFYGKAGYLFKETENGQFSLLRSYQTYLCIYVVMPKLKTSVMRLWGDRWSDTTTRHIQSFLSYIGMIEPVDSILDNFKGGWANRLGQVGDIVVMQGPDWQESWYENAKS